MYQTAPNIMRKNIETLISKVYCEFCILRHDDGNGMFGYVGTTVEENKKKNHTQKKSTT